VKNPLKAAVHVVTVVALLAVSPAVHAQIPAITELPESLGLIERYHELLQRRVALVERRGALAARVSAHNSRCSQVVRGTPQADACQKAQTALVQERSSYVDAVNRFNADVMAATAASEKAGIAPDRTYTPSGDALIGGTTWITGYYVPPGSAPALKARAAAALRQQMAAAGIPYSEAIDFTRYDFVIGIGASTDAFTDLRKRVLFDNLTNGQATPQMQTAYAALKGRAFGEIGCHSNGAMICLAALENRDIQADRVVLYGPQVTLESLHMWQELIEAGRIKSVQMYVNQNDPVPAISMVFGAPTLTDAVASLPLFKVETMSAVVHEAAPSIGVKTFACGGSIPTLDCHDLARYKAERGCRVLPSSSVVVPGTKLPGGQGVFEPPPPC